MPVSYRIDTARGMVFSVATGDVTDEELLDHQTRLTTDGDFDRGLWQLYDLRYASFDKITAGGMRKLAQGNPFGKGARRAAVAGHDIVFGMARMFEMMRGESEDEVRVFRTFDEAVDWLGLRSRPR